MQRTAGPHDESTADLGVPPAMPDERAVDPMETALDEVSFSSRYVERMLLGRGGMGEVHLCSDQRIGREIAVKLTRPEKNARGELSARFVREARVQGQLEHPAIVPVYDLGRRPDGTLFFTMRRVRGLTLRQIIDGLERGDPELVRTYSRRKLLTAFVSVCQAVHFAHTRGVLHRDLKPANVMLGDFGEVYVLDWGLAKLMNGRSGGERIDAVSTGGSAVISATIMGTPGYMAPEQLEGDIDRLDERTDVYALGTVLYELLTWQRLNSGRDRTQPMPQWADGSHASAAARDLPPELERVCLRATAPAPADRYPSVRELFDDVERFLDGDRDLERRRELAAAAAQAAEAAAQRALDDRDEAARREALQHAGRALALDPENTAAMGALLRLLVAPPAELPAEVRRDLAHEQAELGRSTSIEAGWAYGAWLLFAPGLMWMGVRDARVIATWAALVASVSAIGFLAPRWRVSHAARHFVGFALLCGAILLVSQMAGPFILAPVLACTSTIAFLLPVPRSFRWPTFLMGAVTLVLPSLAEIFGWIPRTTSFTDDTIVIRSWAFHLPLVPTMLLFMAGLVASLVVAGLFVLRVRDQLSAAEQRLHLQSWHLRQLLPTEAQGALAPADRS